MRARHIFLATAVALAGLSSTANAANPGGTQTEDEVYIGVKRNGGDDIGTGGSKKPVLGTNKNGGGGSGVEDGAKPPKRDGTRSKSGTDEGGDVDDLEIHRHTTGDNDGVGMIKKPLGGGAISRPVEAMPQMEKPEKVPRPGGDNEFKNPKDTGKP
jgi:opacity protein-like surface antigen